MGQYWIPMNLDKGEFVDSHRLGAGLKLIEQLWNTPGTQAALLVLLSPVGQSGDLFYEDEAKTKKAREYAEIAKRTIGRWAGDRISYLGDYTKDEDLPNSPIPASTLYKKCRETNHIEHMKKIPKGYKGYAVTDGRPDSPTYGMYEIWVKDADPEFKDISDDVCAVLEHVLKGKFEGDGWREWWSAEALAERKLTEKEKQEAEENPRNLLVG